MSGPKCEHGKPRYLCEKCSPDAEAVLREKLRQATTALSMCEMGADQQESALDEIREIAEDYADGAPDASAEEKAWMRVLAAAERGMNR